ncbi:MAG: hypothetical protein HC788_10505, partial [Sphingopyxis sp.]|nr:hypothetical protein [Sphingopyxis sp.]
GYIPNLQVSGQLVNFLTKHRGHVIPSPALLGQIGQQFHQAVKTFAQQHQVPIVHFEPKQRKDDVAAEYRQKFSQTEGVVFIGVAQEKANSFKATKKAKSGYVSFDFSRQSVRVTAPMLKRIEYLIRPRLAVLTQFPVTILVGLQTLLMALMTTWIQGTFILSSRARKREVKVDKFILDYETRYPGLKRVQGCAFFFAGVFLAGGFFFAWPMRLGRVYSDETPAVHLQGPLRLLSDDNYKAARAARRAGASMCRAARVDCRVQEWQRWKSRDQAGMPAPRRARYARHSGHRQRLRTGNSHQIR